MRLPRRELLLSAATLLVLLAAAEIGLRLTEYRHVGTPAAGWPPHYFREHPLLGADHAVDFPPAGFRFRGPAHEIFTNHLGCFDLERPVEDGYFLALGDSYTWGYAPLERKWTTVLERGTGRQVLKCGVAGVGPRFELLKGRQVIERIGRPPGLVLVLYTGTTDFNDDVLFPGYAVVDGQRVSNVESLDLTSGRVTRRDRAELRERMRRLSAPGPGSLKRFLRDHSVLFRLASEVGKRPPPGSPAGPLLRSRYGFNLLDVDPERYPWIVEAFEAHLDNLRALRDDAAARGAGFVLIHTGLEVQEGELAGRLRAFLAGEIPHTFDVGAFLRRRSGDGPPTYRFDGHWNERGNRLVAEGIESYLRRAGLL